MNESTDILRARYRTAFRSFAAEAARMRALSISGSDDAKLSTVKQLHEQLELLTRTEKAYRHVRLEYAHRLLAEQAQL